MNSMDKMEDYDRLARVAAAQAETIAELTKACAMKDAVLKETREFLACRSVAIGFGARVSEAISASPQQVSEWERKQLEPLQAQVAVLHSALDKASKGYPDGYFDSELSDTQATAEQFIAECEQRGAVKAHQEYTVMGALHNYAFYLYPPFPEGSKLLFERATSKKAG